MIVIALLYVCRSRFAPLGFDSSAICFPRFATDVPLAVTAGFAYGGNKNNIARVGVVGEF